MVPLRTNDDDDDDDDDNDAAFIAQLYWGSSAVSGRLVFCVVL